MPLPSKRETTAISDHRKPSGEAVDFKEYLRAGPDFDDLDLSGHVLDEQPDWPMFESGGTPALSDEVTQAVARGAAKQ